LFGPVQFPTPLQFETSEQSNKEQFKPLYPGLQVQLFGPEQDPLVVDVQLFLNVHMGFAQLIPEYPE